ncbi:hypothetical protein ABAC460_10020 [Asticcacaulis sp. AC460]|uniref:hypothetical protein n=1 Tax=Asticcacaulis sp. AC460 TaxID=1282360 RepID=UPI0003C40F95|nr:hypothetical protein [Asticcacaulis sp. AC460]ESQ90095.1 hypothetical protein ABAC460_10020 [Asticcacaulis sp. AC460]
MTEPATGQIYAFRTTPFNEFSPPQTGRYAVFKVLVVTPKQVAVVVLDGIWPKVPTLEDAQTADILHENCFFHINSGQPAVRGLSRDGWRLDGFEDIVLLGVAGLTDAERKRADLFGRSTIGVSFGPLHSVSWSAEGEWRWAHDRDALLAENEQQKARDQAERAAAAERFRSRLSKLTWEQLLSETPFEGWTPSPPFPPEDFTLAARSVVRQACMDLRGLGAKPRKADVRRILKATVEWFNTAGAEAGDVIETEEREDICELLEEMAHVARQDALVDEIDSWRDW